MRLDFWNHLQFNLKLEKQTEKPTMYELNNSNLTFSPLLKICLGSKATETSSAPMSPLAGVGGTGGSSTKRNTDKCNSNAMQLIQIKFERKYLEIT